MSIFHVTINKTCFEVDAASATEAIVIALDTYGTAITEEPDNCLINNANQGLCVCAEYAGELTEAVAP